MAIGRILIGSIGLLVCRGYAHSSSNFWSFSVMVGISKCPKQCHYILCKSTKKMCTKKKQRKEKHRLNSNVLMSGFGNTKQCQVKVMKNVIFNLLLK